VVEDVANELIRVTHSEADSRTATCSARSVRAELIASVSLPARSFTRRLPDVGWLVQTAQPNVLVLGEDLREKVRFPLPSTWRGAHWVAPTLDLVAVSERERVLLIDARGRIVWAFSHHAWGVGGSESGCCWVSPDRNYVWATAPTEDGPDQWLVLDATHGGLVGASQLQCHAAGSHPVPHPDGSHVGLSVGEGQDGADVYWGCWEDGRPAVARLDDRGRVLIDVRPSGRQYLTTPHGSADDAVAVHEFPSGRVVARLTSERVLAEDDWFDFTAGYVSEDLVVVGSAQERGHFVLAADTLEPISRVDYPESHTKGCITPTGRGTWLTSDYPTGRHELWRLAEDA
jgi:hypothetical protein